MTNELKLIEALCEALGFNVISVKDYQERKITINEARSRGYFGGDIVFYNPQDGIAPNTTRARKLKTFNNAFDIDDNCLYTEQLIEPVVSYELLESTK